MSREIKFRGLDVMTGDWVYGSYVKTAFGMHYIIPQNLIADVLPQFQVDKETVGQFTGLKDKNGLDIYEGDIAEVTYMGFTRFRVKIVFGEYEQDGSGGEYSPDKCIGFYAKALDPDTLGDDGCRIVPDYLKTTSILSFESVEVIGNIYENPELLEVKNNE